MNIAVYGASSTHLSDTYLSAAYKTGRLIALAGHSLIYGGGKTGMMGRVFEGADSLGGKTVGIAPKFFDEPGELCRSCTEFVFTDTMAQRKTLIEDMADAFIVLPGGSGTMEEFFETLTLRQLGCHSKPIAVLNINGCYDSLVALLSTFVDEALMTRRGFELFRVFSEPEEALEYVSTHRVEQAQVSISGYGK